MTKMLILSPTAGQIKALQKVMNPNNILGRNAENALKNQEAEPSVPAMCCYMQGARLWIGTCTTDEYPEVSFFKFLIACKLGKT